MYLATAIFYPTQVIVTTDGFVQSDQRPYPWRGADYHLGASADRILENALLAFVGDTSHRFGDYWAIFGLTLHLGRYCIGVTAIEDDLDPHPKGEGCIEQFLEEAPTGVYSANWIIGGVSVPVEAGGRGWVACHIISADEPTERRAVIPRSIIIQPGRVELLSGIQMIVGSFAALLLA